MARRPELSIIDHIMHQQAPLGTEVQWASTFCSNMEKHRVNSLSLYNLQADLALQIDEQACQYCLEVKVCQATTKRP